MGPTVPGAPQNLQASPSNGQNYLGWQAPSSDGGATITRYRVFRGTTTSNETLVTTGGCANLGVILSCTDTGLTNGQIYYYFVSADNSVGTGLPSNVVNATPTGPTVPGAPQNLQASPSNGQNYLGWQAPSSDGGATITRYRVFRGTTTSNETLVTTGGCANLGVILSCTDTGLTNGQIYYYFVSADNSVGQGPPSNGATATPATSTTPTLTAALSANPASGTAPLSTTLTATSGGTAAGPVNFTFWWNCPSAGTSVSAVVPTCGDPANATFGAKFNGVNGATQVAKTTYATSGTYSAKVIIEQGGAPPAEQRSSITVVSGNETVLPAPAPSGPTGSNASTSPTFGWSAVRGATSYHLMLATSAGVLPSDPASASCNGCVLTTTPHTNYYTPSTPLNAATTYYWQVQGRSATKNGTWSTPVSFTTAPPPDQTQPDRGNLAEDSSSLALGPTLASHAVVITHGWNADATGWVQQMAARICDKLNAGLIVSGVKANYLTRLCHTTNWDVWVLDWKSNAANACTLFCPWEAYTNATDIGENLALKLKGKHYSHIHFIAHSAGANLIDFATVWLRVWVPKEDGLQIHETFLDAYDPVSDATRYGKQADWADNYVDTRDVTVYLNAFGLDGTKLFLQNGYNVDVTPIITPLVGYDGCQANSANPIVVAQCRHSRPYRFYGLSVDSSFTDPGDPLSAAYDPINGTGGMGYPLSLESGHSLSLLYSLYQPGGKCLMDKDICYAGALPPNAWSFLPGAVAGTVIDAATGAVNYVAGAGSTLFDSISLGSAWLLPYSGPAIRTGLSAGTSAEPPSSITARVTTTQAVNTMRFNWNFAASGEGFLRVFVDGILVREIDQRHVSTASLAAEEIYIGGETGTLTPATHLIVFRLDGFSTLANGVQLAGVQLGLRSSPMPHPRAVRP